MARPETSPDDVRRATDEMMRQLVDLVESLRHDRAPDPLGVVRSASVVAVFGVRPYDLSMALHPNGIHHLALSTTDIKTQIAFFTDVLGGELKALYWMHGVENTFHGFVQLNPSCCVAFVQHPDNSQRNELGVTHAGNAGGPMPGGTMQHIAFNVDTLDDLYAMRDRIRSRGIPVIGPMDHGMCQSMYFAGPEGLCLEVATGANIDYRAWIDPEVQELAGITDAELSTYVSPATYEPPATAVPQVSYENARLNLVYPADRYRAMLATPDESFWNAVVSEPPVKVELDPMNV